MQRCSFAPPRRKLFRSLKGRRKPSTGILSPRRSSDRKSTRLNSSHLVISYAVFCLKKKHNESLLGPLVRSPSTANRPHSVIRSTRRRLALIRPYKDPAAAPLSDHSTRLHDCAILSE